MNPFEINSLQNRRIKRKKDLSFEEAYLDLQMEESEILDDTRMPIDRRVLLVGLILCFAVLAGRIYVLQAVKGEEYRNKAFGNKLRVQYLLAPRGLIIDSKNKVIASNIPAFELVVIPSDLPKAAAELDLEILEAAKILGKDKNELGQMLEKLDINSFQAVSLVEHISKEQALVLISKQKELPGLVVQNNPIRDYKDAPVFSHLVGYAGKITQEELAANENKGYLLNDYFGKTGLENEYESYIRGKPGQKQTEIDAKGTVKSSLPDVPAVPGNNIKLNVDADLQKVLYESLVKIMKRGSAKKAAGIITEALTGKVLALTNLPSFDNNWFAKGVSGNEYASLINDPNLPLLNRAINGTYPPGSTVKPMLAIAALTEGVVTPETKIIDDGVIRVGNFTFYGYDREGLGPMDIYSAIARSSDIYFYTIGGGNPKNTIQGLGPEKIAAWMRKFNLGKILGIDLPGEKSGLVPDPEWKLKTKDEPWYLGNTYHFSIGQGDLLVTPLQVNSWTATIANGGKVMQPYVVDEVVFLDGKVVEKKEPKVLAENFLDPKWVKVAQDGMRQTVIAGSARALNTLPIEISGKTGTAQFDARNLNLTHAWFTSYAPATNPEIVVTILVESGGEGSSVAVPVAKEVYSWWAANRR